MNEPRRLSQSGGVSQRLLDSASLDRPSAAARRRAALLAATASSFSTTSSRVAVAEAPRAGVVRTLVTWIAIGAAASVTLALGASRLLDASSGASVGHGAAPALAELPAAPSAASGPSPDIVAEPKQAVAEPSIAAAPEELAEMDGVRALLSRGDDAGAITALDGYDRAHPSGPLKAESTALRIQALSHSGRTTEARALANEFLSKYPAHPLASRVRTLAQ